MRQVSYGLTIFVLCFCTALPIQGEDLQEAVLGIQSVHYTQVSKRKNAPSEAFLLYLAEIEVVSGDMLDPVALTQGLARHSREKKVPEVSVSTKPKTVVDDGDAVNE